MSARRHPLDFDALEKGSNISAEELQDILQAQPGTRAFDLKRLALRSQIMSEMAGRGVVATVKNMGDGLRILTDSEAAIHNDKVQKRAMRMMGRALIRQQGVDESRLSDPERELHQRRLQRNAFILSSMKSAQRKRLSRPNGDS